MNNYEHLKQKLEAEKALLEREMNDVGQKNLDQAGDWEPVSKDRDVSQADDNTNANAIEELEDNASVLNTLETRHQEELEALESLEDGTYGKCEVCGAEIEMDRLEANPSAKTCKAHM